METIRSKCATAICRAADASDLSTSPRSTLFQRALPTSAITRDGAIKASIPRTATAGPESGSGRTDFTATLASTTIIDGDRCYRAIPGYRRWNFPTRSQSFCASGRLQPKPPLSTAAIFPPTDRAPSAPLTCRGRRQLGAAAHRSQDQDQELLGRACALSLLSHAHLFRMRVARIERKRNP